MCVCCMQSRIPLAASAARLEKKGDKYIGKPTMNLCSPTLAMQCHRLALADMRARVSICDHFRMVPGVCPVPGVCTCCELCLPCTKAQD